MSALPSPSDHNVTSFMSVNCENHHGLWSDSVPQATRQLLAAVGRTLVHHLLGVQVPQASTCARAVPRARAVPAVPASSDARAVFGDSGAATDSRI
jgi:hypothetical protein